MANNLTHKGNINLTNNSSAINFKMKCISYQNACTAFSKETQGGFFVMMVVVVVLTD